MVASITASVTRPRCAASGLAVSAVKVLLS
jgi:hypothetical protein